MKFVYGVCKTKILPRLDKNSGSATDPDQAQDVLNQEETRVIRSLKTRTHVNTITYQVTNSKIQPNKVISSPKQGSGLNHHIFYNRN
jgi:hypothetical protein